MRPTTTSVYGGGGSPAKRSVKSSSPLASVRRNNQPLPPPPPADIMAIPPQAAASSASFNSLLQSPLRSQSSILLAEESPLLSNDRLATQNSSIGSLERTDSKSENVIVSVRVRPLSESELGSYQQHVWDILPGPLGRIAMNEGWRERLRKPINSVEYQYGTL